MPKKVQHKAIMLYLFVCIIYICLLTTSFKWVCVCVCVMGLCSSVWRLANSFRVGVSWVVILLCVSLLLHLLVGFVLVSLPFDSARLTFRVIRAGRIFLCLLILCVCV